MERLHPIVEKWITRHEEFRREALKSSSEWIRNDPPAALSETDHRRHRIVSQLLRTLEGRGAKISETESGDLRATIDGEHLEFRIRERNRETREFSKDRRNVERKLVGTGQLIFALRTYLRGKHNEEWRERDSSALEDQLAQIVERLFEGSQILKAWREEREEQERRRERAAAERAEKAQLAQLERKRCEALAQSAVDWRLANELREFIAAIRSQPFESRQEVKGKTLAEWLSWADAVADTLDPLRNGPGGFFNSIDSGD